MSTHLRITIACDAPGCIERLTWEAVGKGGLNLSSTQASARRRYGWAVSGQTAKCPTHRRKVTPHEFVEPANGLVKDFCAHRSGRGRCWQRQDEAVHAVPS